MIKAITIHPATDAESFLLMLISEELKSRKFFNTLLELGLDNSYYQPHLDEATLSCLGITHGEDDRVRADSSLVGLAKLKPFFDRKYGRVTPGNSSQITDGAAWLILASQDAVDKWDLKPLGRIIDSQWAGLDPAQMGLGPVHAATPILQRQGLALADVDLWEINEAFAGQVLGCPPPGSRTSTAESS